MEDALANRSLIGREGAPFSYAVSNIRLYIRMYQEVYMSVVS